MVVFGACTEHPKLEHALFSTSGNEIYLDCLLLSEKS